MTHAQEFALFSLVALWSALSLAWGIYRRHRRRRDPSRIISRARRRHDDLVFRSHHLRRGGYLKLTASSTTRAGRESTMLRTRRSAASSNSTGATDVRRGAPGARSAGLEILPLRPERSRSTGGGLNGTISPLMDGQSTGDPGRRQATAGSELAGLSIAHALNTINEHSIRYLTHEVSAEQFAEETLRALETCGEYLAANNGAKQ